jgi:hypothetical protein
MREINDTQANRGPGLRVWWVPAAFLILALGVALGRWAFPQEVVKVVTVEKEKRVEVPVERIVEKRVPVDRIVEKRVEVPVEVIKYVDRPLTVDKKNQESGPKPSFFVWQQLREGMTESAVRALLGKPSQVFESHFHSSWYYGDPSHDGWVDFRDGFVRDWGMPSR